MNRGAWALTKPWLAEKQYWYLIKWDVAADLVVEGVNGALIFKSGDIDSLSKELNLLTRDKELLKRCGEQSRTIIIKVDWNFTDIAKAIEKKINETN